MPCCIGVEQADVSRVCLETLCLQVNRMRFSLEEETAAPSQMPPCSLIKLAHVTQMYDFNAICDVHI